MLIRFATNCMQISCPPFLKMALLGSHGSKIGSTFKVLLINNNPLSKQCQSSSFLLLKSNDSSSCRHASTQDMAVNSLSAVKRGTGGRSSFSGVVATVFGASGNLGRYVVNRLGKIGSQVIIPYRGDHYDVLRLKLCGDLGQILYQPFNLKDKDALYKAMKYSNVVINLIGRDYETSNFSFNDVHVEGARNIARIARECGVEKLVHVSALNISPNPKPIVLKKGSGFLKSKYEGENAVIEEFPDAIIFRPADIWGSDDRFLRYYAGLWRTHGTTMPLWNKGVGIIKQPVYVCDVAQGIVNSIFDKSSVGQTYQAVGPNRYELSELIDWFHRVMRKTEEWGFVRSELKYSPLFWLKVKLTEKMYPKYPKLSAERIEREHVQDDLILGLPTLEDLGVQLTYMEDRMHFELKAFKAHAYYREDFGEFEPPAPPKLANA